MKKSNNTISNWLKKYRNPEIEEQVEKEIEMGEKSPLIDLSNKETQQDELNQNYEVNKNNLFIDQRVRELEEALRECQEVFDQMEENSMCNFIEKILNKDE